MNVKELIWERLEDARQLALSEVEKMARNILTNHPELDEYVMAMGTAFFTVKNEPRITLDLTEKPYMRSLDDFLNEFDRVLKLTGESMTFTATGPKITEWSTPPVKRQ